MSAGPAAGATARPGMTMISEHRTAAAETPSAVEYGPQYMPGTCDAGTGGSAGGSAGGAAAVDADRGRRRGASRAPSRGGAWSAEVSGTSSR